MPENSVPSHGEESEMPDWITAGYFETLLRTNTGNSTVKVTDVQVRYAVPKGENYASVIYRVQVTFHVKDQFEISKSFVVKCMLTKGMALEKLGKYDVQRKEMDVYDHVIPELKRLMRSIGDNGELYPTAFAIDRKRDVIIFNDLAPCGYVMYDRARPLDVTHLKMSFKLMAKMHAASMKLAEEQPNIFARYKMGMVTRETDAFHHLFNSIYDAVTTEVGLWGPEWQRYHKKLSNLRPHFVEQATRMCDHEREDDLRAFVNGDLWINNLLFKYDATTGKPLDAILLDFQYSCYTSPLVDFCYLFYTAARDEFHQAHFEELLQYYYYQLAKCVQKLGYGGKFPTPFQFQQQMQRKMFYAIYSTMVALPVQMNDKTEDADFEALVGNDERSKRYKKTIATNEQYQKILKSLLPKFDRMGLLDKLD